MNQKMLTICGIIVTALHWQGLFATSPIAYAEDGDSSETSTDQSVKQKNTGSGDSANSNCGQNLLEAGVEDQECDLED